MVIWVNFVQNYMFIVFSYCNIDISIDEDTFIEPFALYTAISRKVVGESARDNPEKYCGHERPWTYVCEG